MLVVSVPVVSFHETASRVQFTNASSPYVGTGDRIDNNKGIAASRIRVSTPNLSMRVADQSSQGRGNSLLDLQRFEFDNGAALLLPSLCDGRALVSGDH